MSSGDIGFSGDQPKPVQDVYAVFRRTPRKDDLQAEKSARDDAYAAVDPGSDPTGVEASLGEPIYIETRLLSGTPGHGVYALPTTKDAVCVGLMPDGGGGCGNPGPHGLTVDYNDASAGSPFVLYGLVGDDVASLDLVLSGATVHPRVNENSYVLTLPDGRGAEIDNIVLHLRDGTTDRLKTP